MSQTAEQIIARSIEAMGGRETAVSIQSIHAVANCTAPYGEYMTEIHSARRQRLHFRQEWPERQPFVATINKQHGWATNAQTGDVQNLADISVAMLHSHEFQMIPLTLAERFRHLAAGSPTSFAGKACVTIQANDELAKPCTLYFDSQTGLMAGFVIVNPIGEEGETVRTVFNQWQTVDNIKLPTNVTATDKNGDFILDFHTIELNTVDETIFAVPSAITGKEE